MSDDTVTTPAPNPVVRHDDTVSLLAGIIADFQALVVQQIRLTRQELTANLELRWTATAVLLAGVGLGFLALMVLSLGLVHLLHWSASPAGTDPAWLPLGGCYGVVSAALFSLSAGLVYLGRRQFRAVPPWQNLADDLLVRK